MKNNKNHEVYVVKDLENNYLYIGSGQLGRHKHCSSGTSHVYALNEMHFLKQEYRVEVIKVGLTKQESLAIERDMIERLSPRFNKDFNVKDKLVKMSSMSGISKKIVSYILNSEMESNKNNKIKWSRIVGSLFKAFGTSNVIKGVYLGEAECRKFTSTGYTSGKYKIFNTIFSTEKGILFIKKEFIESLLSEESQNDR